GIQPRRACFAGFGCRHAPGSIARAAGTGVRAAHAVFRGVMAMAANAPPAFSEQPLPPWKRAVLKVGSSLLAAPGGGLTPRHALALAQWVSANAQAGREVVIVSSGAVAAGRAILPRAAEAGAALAAKQALAALGQAQLIG